MEKWNDGKIEGVGAKHSSQGVKVIPAAVTRMLRLLWSDGNREKHEKKLNDRKLEGWIDGIVNNEQL